MAAAGIASAHGDDHDRTAFGEQGDSAQVSNTIQVGMNDAMRFTPATFTVKKGQTVRFVVRNDGKLPHEMVLGTRAVLKEHAEMMKQHPGMDHADASMARVAPGKSGEIVWRFTEAGEFEFACLQPGHLEAGMAGKVVVR